MNGSSTLPAGTAMRTALIDAALRILHRDGAAALTVRSITAEAGCSTTGVYTYFGGKLGLVEAIYVEGFESFDRALDPLLERGDIAGSGLAYRHWALEHPTQYMVMFGRAVPEFEPSDEARSRGLVSFAKLAEAIARGVPTHSARGEKACKVGIEGNDFGLWIGEQGDCTQNSYRAAHVE